LADYRVNLDIFAGPLDLLLYLVRKEEVDIYDIPIARVTDQYIRHIEMLKSLDIDLAGDFLVMAATLMHIKSAMLLPRAEPEQLGDDELTDPRAELVRQLLEYKKFKDAANFLNAASDEQQERFSRPSTIVEQLKPDTEPEVDIEQVSVWNLLEAFDSLMAATGSTYDTGHIVDDTPIDLYQIEILHRLQTEGPMNFGRIFESKTNRVVIVGLFLALLELVREKLVWVEQASPSQLYLRALTNEPAEQVVQKAILTSDSELKDQQSSQPQNQQQSVIPIAELPGRDKPQVATNTGHQKELPVPIVELLSEKITVVPSENMDKRQ